MHCLSSMPQLYKNKGATMFLYACGAVAVALVDRCTCLLNALKYSSIHHEPFLIAHMNADTSHVVCKKTNDLLHGPIDAEKEGLREEHAKEL